MLHQKRIFHRSLMVVDQALEKNASLQNFDSCWMMTSRYNLLIFVVSVISLLFVESATFLPFVVSVIFRFFEVAERSAFLGDYLGNVIDDSFQQHSCVVDDMIVDDGGPDYPDNGALDLMVEIACVFLSIWMYHHDLGDIDCENELIREHPCLRYGVL